MREETDGNVHWRMSLTDPTRDENGAAADDTRLKGLRPGNRHQALGMAVAFLMSDPAFQGVRFGHWARVLAGQVRRGHFLFVTRRHDVVGFAGWTLTDHDSAEAWLAGRSDIGFEDSQIGNHVILNVWKATTPAANRFLVDALRRLFRSRQALYYKRFYADGRVRPARLRVNDFVAGHIGAEGSGTDDPSTDPSDTECR